MEKTGDIFGLRTNGGLGWARTSGEGGQQYEKKIFAFLDELDHLEAKKNINF